jgi:chromatin remodeling complex protein RSC6
MFKFNAKGKITKSEVKRSFKIENLIGLERYFRKEIEKKEIWKYIR